MSKSKEENLSKIKSDLAISILEQIREDTDIPVRSIADASKVLCAIANCYNCPVIIYNADNRTKQDHDNGVECYTQLVNWIYQRARSEQDEKY